MSLQISNENGVVGIPVATAKNQAGAYAQAGSVIQVVNGSTSTTVSNATTSYVDTLLTTTITPKFSTSKILVIINHQDCYKNATSTANGIHMKLFRGATDLGLIAYFAGYQGAATNLYFPIQATVLDLPATTSAITYKTQFANNTASANTQVQPNGAGGAPSTITLMEIAQ